MRKIPEALARRFAEIEPAMLDWAAAICGDDSLAEDAVQEAFVRALRYQKRFDGRADLKTWMLKITRNCALNLRRRRRRRRTAPADLAERPDGRAPVNPTAEVADELERLKRFVDALPPEQREAFILRHVHGMPYERIAEVLAVPAGTVKSRIHHAVAKLRAAMLEKES
jgi:RNA polymerase sigma-70 factor (ECF subfamily)